MDEMLTAYLPRIHQALDASEGLRNRIQNAERTLAEIKAGKHPTWGPEHVPGGEAQLEALRLELREHEWWQILSVGAIYTWAMGELAANMSLDEHWRFPAGSHVRIVIPGHINIAMELT
jgi:hypothetical protein